MSSAYAMLFVWAHSGEGRCHWCKKLCIVFWYSYVIGKVQEMRGTVWYWYVRAGMMFVLYSLSLLCWFGWEARCLWDATKEGEWWTYEMGDADGGCSVCDKVWEDACEGGRYVVLYNYDQNRAYLKQKCIKWHVISLDRKFCQLFGGITCHFVCAWEKKLQYFFWNFPLF